MKRRINVILWSLVLVLGLVGSVHALRSYLNSFNSTYGTTATVLNNCTLCHIPPGQSLNNLNNYANDYANSGYSFAAIEPLDSDGDGFTNIVEINARTFPGDPTSFPAVAGDTTPPIVTAFVIPTTATSLTVSITTFTATDNILVTGYLVTETSTIPAAGAAGWTATAPTSYTFTTAGAKTLYAWAKDAAGNVSIPLSAAVTITLPDATPPTVTAFTIPASATSLTVSITTFTATDNILVTGYLVTETSTIPAAGAAGWTATAPTSYTFTTAGAKTLYAWAKDAAGNVSIPLSAAVTITLPDATPPVVTAFVIPATATSLTVSITTFTATDNVLVTGYLVTETSTIPAAGAAGWTATAPTSYTASSLGTKTFYAWAKDAAGNVSAPLSATVTISVPDVLPPTVTAFVIPATATSLTVPITTFTAFDDIAVTGYMVTETSTAPAANDPGWSPTAPTSYTFSSAGVKTLYAWAKDLGGGVSSAVSATVTVTLPDTVPPTVTAFVIPVTSASLIVPITTFTATDNVAVTGYLVTETSAGPSPADPGWTATVPASHTFTTPGAKTLFAWAKDAAGNVSVITANSSASVAIALADTVPPTVTAFTIPATATSLTVSITAFTAFDAVGVTGYMATESSTAPAANDPGWSPTPPASHTFAAAGSRTLNAWAKDAAGNISAPAQATVTITLPDTTPPTVTAFVIPSTSSTLTVAITIFTATDDVGVTGYMVTESSTAPVANDPGWSPNPPASHTFATAGSKTLNGWAKDAAGNISAPVQAIVTIALPDTTPPTVTAFVLGQPTGMIVPVTTFTAADNAGGSGVTAYLITETSSVPSPLLAQWTSTVPTSYTFSGGGNKTLYAWAKDAAGNVSTTTASASVTITPPDSTAPVVTAFTIPATLAVQNITQGIAIQITTFTATDDVAVTGYLITESATPPNPGAAGWTGIAPTQYTVITAGTKTLYAWAKDAAGNVSAPASATITITLPPTYNPTSPTPDGLTNVSLTPTLRITVSFPSPDGDVQRSTTWEVCTDNTFAADKIVFKSALDTVNLTSIVVPAGVLKANTVYFWRASTIDSGGDLSNPSPTASFTTLMIPMDAAFGVVPDSMTVKKAGAEVTNLSTLTPADGAISPQLIADTAGNQALNGGAASDLTKPGLMIAREKGGATTDIIGLTTAAGVRIDNMVTTDANDPSFTNGTPPGNVSLPHGVLSFRISNVTPGAPVVIQVYPATLLPDNAEWFKYSTTRGWLRIDSTGTYDSNNNLLSANTTFRVTNGHGVLTIKDDDVADYSTEVIGGKAVVLDPGAPGVPVASAPVVGTGGGGGGCFIATAAFGSYFDPYVKILRDFRDTYLMTNRLGRGFVQWYYRISPPIADYIAQSPTLKATVRFSLLPAVGFSVLVLHLGPAWAFLLILLVVVLAFTALHWRRTQR